MSTTWDRWAGDHAPLEFLDRIDRDVSAGRWRNRRAAFLDYAIWSLREVYPPPDPRRHVARWLAERLLNHAEQCEREALGEEPPGPILTDILNLPVYSR